MLDRGLQVASGFEWRAQTSAWRWLILGALGAAGCDGPSSGGVEVDSQGASGNASIAQTGGAAGSGTAVANLSCEAPFTDLGGGWERCGNGLIHRRELGSCTSNVPRPEGATNSYHAGADAGYLGECRSDSDCVANTFGHCEPDPYLGGTYCEYGCVTNADCRPGYACFCTEPVGQCRPAECATDADCNDGLLCSEHTRDPGCGGPAYACQQAADACASSSDCPANQYCVRGAFGGDAYDGPSYCSYAQCAVGRPFLIAGDERLAPAVARDDWYGAEGPIGAATSLSPALREAVHRGWLEQALMEHASVAAFARFSLQLLALGAPAELNQRAASAMLDEIAHARACFELARRHSDDDVGPGPLDVAGALDTSDLESIVLGTIAEGCIGETVAAIEAAEALAHCEDEAARTTLARIASDETRHAELAWQFVAWALEIGPATLRERAHAAFTRAVQVAPEPITPSGLERELARHGLIAPALRAELRRRVLRDVIEPCARALLELPERASTASRSSADVSWLSA